MHSHDNKFIENNFAFANNGVDTDNISVSGHLDAELADAFSMGPGGPQPKKKKPAIAKVLSKNGTVKRSDNTTIWAGTELTEDDTIVIPHGGYITIIPINGGKTLEIKQAGIYKVKDLVAKLNSKNSSTTEKFANHVGKEMTKKTDAEIRKDMQNNHRKYMANHSGVERNY